MSVATGTPTDFVSQFLTALAELAITDARAMIASLLNSFGPSTEPDFSAIGPVYDRMLAISLLVLGAVIAFALIERIAGGTSGAGGHVLGRTLAAVFAAYSGLGVAEYVCHYTGLLATAWSPDLAVIANRLSSLGAQDVVNGHSGTSVLALVFTAFLLTFLALLVYLELIVRSALVLVLTAFMPLVCVLAVWPRMASAATHLFEFLLGLLLSKFVVATAVYIGFRLILPSILGVGSGGPNWMSSGIAVLLIAAFAPVALFQGLRFAHHSAGSVARNWAGAAVGMAPLSRIGGFASDLARHPRAQAAVNRVAESTRSQLSRFIQK